ncbi:MAG: PadR family transcriptional regulator [Candidatus Bathyarchaeota archaeon]|nr:PadR family transcriptional regulator [Candidatus Bathyarchaeota archaeon]
MELNGLTDLYHDQFIQRLIMNLLDVHLLRIVKNQPLWGYKIKKNIENVFNIRIRHSVLYPTLNDLEKKGFLNSQKQTKSGRVRKVYTITAKGKKYIESYYAVLDDQINCKDLT